jgi:hypothetical protein
MTAVDQCISQHGGPSFTSQIVTYVTSGGVSLESLQSTFSSIEVSEEVDCWTLKFRSALRVQKSSAFGTHSSSRGSLYIRRTRNANNQRSVVLSVMDQRSLTKLSQGRLPLDIRIVQDLLLPSRQRRRRTRLLLLRLLQRLRLHGNLMGLIRLLSLSLSVRRRRNVTTVRSLHFDVPISSVFLGVSAVVHLNPLVCNAGNRNVLAC